MKFLRYNANMNFNEICLKMKIFPKHAQIKTLTYKIAAKKTRTQPQ
jgi:hypothetical protein